MKYAIPTIADEDLDLAISAEIGAESRVFVSYDDAKILGDIEQDGADLGTLILDTTYRPPSLTNSGRDLQVVCNQAVRSAEEIVISLNVVLAGIAPAPLAITAITEADPAVITTAAHGLTSGNTVTITGTDTTPSINGTHVVTVLTTTTFSIPVAVTDNGSGTGSVAGPDGATANGTATATFSAPGSAQDQSFNFPGGLAVDVIAAGGDPARQIVSVTSIASIAGGAAGNKFVVMALPERASYNEVMCATDKNIPLPSPKSVAIPCRFDGSRWVKKGRSEAPTAEIKGKYTSFGDGLPRINGQRITMMLETRKDDRILTERLVLTGWRPTVNITKGDGEAEAEATASGLYEKVAAFV